MNVAGRVALVTGARVGTGRAIADALEAEGADVVRSDLDDADLTVDDDVHRLLERTRPAILVNNAGGGGHIPPHFPEATPEQWSATLALNLRAPMLATQLAARQGAEAVVNVASSAALGSDPHPSPEYAAAKAGLIRFTSAFRGVRVNCLVPDWVATERVTEEERALTPPLITLDAVAAGVLRLLGDDALSGRALILLRGEPPRLV